MGRRCWRCFGRLRICLRLLRRLFARTVAVLIIVLALCFPSRVVIDAGDRNRSPVRIDANGTPAIFERVLRLRGGARQQECGDSKQLSHSDLLGRQNLKASLHFGSSSERDLHHFLGISRGLVALVQCVSAVNLIQVRMGGQFFETKPVQNRERQIERRKTD